MDEELKQAGENLGLHTAIAMLLAAQSNLKVGALEKVGQAMLADLNKKANGYPDIYQLTVVNEAMKTLESIATLAQAIRDGEIKSDLFASPGSCPQA